MKRRGDMQMSNEKIEFKMLSIEDLEFLPGNPRLEMYDESLKDLAKSIARDGLIEPIVVRPKGNKYEVIAGERRVRAAVLSNIPRLPAIIREGITDKEASRLRLIENMKRKDLTLVEKVEGIKEHMKIHGASLEEVAGELGVKPTTIRKWFLDVERLSPKIKKDIAFLRKLSPDVLALLGKYEFGTQEKLAKIIVDHKLTDWTARRFTDMFEAHPEANLDQLAEESKKQVKTIAVTLPVKEAEKIQKLARKIRQKELKASKKLEKYLRKTQPKQSNIQKEPSTVKLPIETPSIKQQRDIEVVKVSEQHHFTDTQTRRLMQLAEQFPNVAVKDLAEQVEAEIDAIPQILVLEVPGKMYKALEAYANSEEIFVKEAALVLIEEGLENHGFLKGWRTS
jgi:ParB/RepB/Spo0J family partition protein